MARNNGRLRFDEMVPKGENPNGVTQHDPNGTSRVDTGAGEQQWKYCQQADGERWQWPDGSQDSMLVPATPRRKRRG